MTSLPAALPSMLLPSAPHAGAVEKHFQQQETQELGSGDEEQPLLLPTPSFIALQKRSKTPGSALLCCFFLLSFLSDFLGTLYIFVGRARAEDKGALAMSRLRADSGQETDCT